MFLKFILRLSLGDWKTFNGKTAGLGIPSMVFHANHFLKERIALVTLFKKSNWLFLAFQFSFQKGAKPGLKKSELLFHKEQIALVFEKVERAIRSFAQVAILKRATEANRSRSSLK